MSVLGSIICVAFRISLGIGKKLENGNFVKSVMIQWALLEDNKLQRISKLYLL